MPAKRSIPNMLQSASSGCLLPLFLLGWIVLSILVVIFSVLVITGHLDVPGAPPISKSIYYVVAGLYLLYLISAISMIRESESGAWGFILVTVVLFAISTYSGGLPDIGINTFVPAIILLILLRLDEWRNIESDQLVAHYLEVREGEKDHPKTALRLYKRLERLNRDVNPALVFVGALSMPLAYLSGQWLKTHLSLSSNLIESIILAFAGIGPIIWLADWWRTREEKRAAAHKSKAENESNSVLHILDRSLTLVFKQFLIPIFALFTDWLEIAICAVIAVISAIVITGIISLPYRLISLIPGTPPADVYALFTSVVPTLSFGLFILLILVSAAEPRLKPLHRVLPELPAALKTNTENLLSFLTAIVLLMILANPYVHSPFFVSLNTHGEVVQQALAGAMLGYTLSARVRFPILNIFIKLGQARCLRRMGRQTEGFYTVYRLADAMDSKTVPTVYVHLVESVLLQRDPLQSSCEHDLQELRLEALRSASGHLPYFELFNDALEEGL